MDGNDYSLILFILTLLVASAFFSGSETALTATSRARMRMLADQGNRKADRVNKLIADRERLLGAILLGNNLVNILASALATSLFLRLWGENGVVVSTLTMTALVLVFAEVTPKTAAIARPDSFAMLIAAPMRLIVWAFAPITAIVQVLVRIALGLFGFNIDRQANILSAADELRGALDLHHEEGRVDRDARNIIRGALDLDDLKVDEIMVHRKQMETLDIDAPPLTIVEQVLASNYTRIPLWKQNPDNVVGVLHAKDLLRALWDANNDLSRIDVTQISQKPYFVPETTSVQEQLDAFQLNQLHFALIVDEYGALMGLVTLEDILEEIVGEIEDEFDHPIEGITKENGGDVICDGAVTIRDLNRALDWFLPDEEAVTVAGLVIHNAQTIPEVGQLFSFSNFRFEILARRRNQITRIRITPLATDT